MNKMKKRQQEREQMELIDLAEIEDTISKLFQILEEPSLKLDWMAIREWCSKVYQRLATENPMLGKMVPTPFLVDEDWWYQSEFGDWKATDRTTMAEYRHEYAGFAYVYEGVSLTELGPTGWKEGMPMASTKATAYISFAYEVRQRLKLLVTDLEGIMESSLDNQTDKEVPFELIADYLDDFGNVVKQ